MQWLRVEQSKPTIHAEPYTKDNNNEQLVNTIQALKI
jgi:hypothetical protein